VKPQRCIVHLDMDAFFASVELLRYPQLRGQPVVVGGRRKNSEDHTHVQLDSFTRLRDYVGRGVVTTSTYEARALGVFSGMGLMQSARLAPQAILLPSDFQAYKEYSRRFKEVVLQFVSAFEDRGIDEIYFEIEACSDPRAFALRIQRAIGEACGLSCSMGLAPNKLLAKLGSEMRKPNGITVLGYEDIESVIWPLPVQKINGIGPKSAKKLVALGIESVGDLAAVPNTLLEKHFGARYAAWLGDVAHGRDDRALVTEREPKSMSRETTFERNFHIVRDRAELAAQTDQLCQRLSDDLIRRGLMCRSIGVKAKFADFTVVTRETKLMAATQTARALRKAVGECLKRIQWHQEVRLLGVKATGLVSDQEATEPRAQLPLWTGLE
jgi:DNA polymerase IV